MNVLHALSLVFAGGTVGGLLTFFLYRSVFGKKVRALSDELDAINSAVLAVFEAATSKGTEYPHEVRTMTLAKKLRIAGLK